MRRIDAIRQALQMLGALRHFDRKQNEAYVARKFSEVWQEVSDASSDDQSRNDGCISIGPQSRHDGALRAQGEAGGRRDST